MEYDEQGAITSMPWLWRVSSTENDYNGGIVSYPVYSNKGVLLVAENKNGNNYIRFHSIKRGKVIWSQDYISPVTFFNIGDPYIYRNAIIIRDRQNIFSIDLKTGLYNWKMTDEALGFNWLSGIDSLFFSLNSITDPKTGYPITSAFVGNTETGEQKLFLIPDLGDLPTPNLERVNFSLGGFRYLKPFKDMGSGQVLLLCYYYKNYYLPSGSDQVSQSFLGLYNFTLKKWVYERIPLGDYNWLEGFTPTIIGDHIFHVLSEGVAECRNLYTGQIIWRIENDCQYSGCGFIIFNDKLIVMDDRYGNLIAYHISDGHEIWRTKSSSNIGYMQELNGIVYFRGGGDGCIHAVEAETGKYIWHLISPDIKEDPYNYFMDQCFVIPGREGKPGRVIVSSFSHTFCYTAAR